MPILFRTNAIIYLIPKRKKKYRNHDAGCNHGRSVQQLAQDSCKPPPVEPVAQSAIIKRPKSSLHQTRIINAAPQNPKPNIVKKGMSTTIQVPCFSLTSQSIWTRRQASPSPLPLINSGGTLGKVRIGLNWKEENPGMQVRQPWISAAQLPPLLPPATIKKK